MISPMIFVLDFRAVFYPTGGPGYLPPLPPPKIDFALPGIAVFALDIIHLPSRK